MSTDPVITRVSFDDVQNKLSSSSLIQFLGALIFHCEMKHEIITNGVGENEYALLSSTPTGNVIVTEKSITWIGCNQDRSYYQIEIPGRFINTHGTSTLCIGGCTPVECIYIDFTNDYAPLSITTPITGEESSPNLASINQMVAKCWGSEDEDGITETNPPNGTDQSSYKVQLIYSDDFVARHTQGMHSSPENHDNDRDIIDDQEDPVVQAGPMDEYFITDLDEMTLNQEQLAKLQHLDSLLNIPSDITELPPSNTCAHPFGDL